MRYWEHRSKVKMLSILALQIKYYCTLSKSLSTKSNQGHKYLNNFNAKFWTSRVACNTQGKEGSQSSSYHRIFCQTHTQMWLVFPKNASLVEPSRNRQKNIYFLDLTGSQEWKQGWLTQLCQHQIPAHILNQKCRCPWDFKVKNLYAYQPAQSQAVVYQGFSGLWCQLRDRVSFGSGPLVSDPPSVTDKGLPSNNALCHWVNTS